MSNCENFSPQKTTYGMYVTSSVCFIIVILIKLLLIGIDDVIQEINDNPYEGIVFQARRPLVLTNSILIDNIPKHKCTKEQLDVCFTNKKRSGMDSYKEIDFR